MAGVSTGTGFAANVGSEVMSGLWNKIVRVVEMIRDLPRAVRDMNVQVQRLKDVTDDINTVLAQQQRNPKQVVQNWLKKAGEAIESSETIISNEYEEHKNCLGCCPDCVLRYRISKNIRAWKSTVDQLHLEKQSDFPSSGEYGDPTPRTQIPIQSTESGFASNARLSAQTKLVETWLTNKDSDIRRIGIQGMGGVGKTFLLDTINDSQKVRDSFEFIIKVTVSKNHILDMQDCVADRLNILREFPDKSNFEGRKDRLRSYLKNKKYLILLDDMWVEDMWRSDQLQNLGVSLNDTGFKIVLTTRDKQVCARMNVQETITVEPLLEDDSWELFRSRAFENRNGIVPQEIEEAARKIAKECKGLPLAINVVAAAMTHHTDVHDWEVALDQMRNVDETFSDLHPGVDTELFQRLKWSYDALKSDNLKVCFLYFAAYPEDSEINCGEVIDMWIAEGVVKGSGDSYLNDIGYSFISHLRDRCLIEVIDKNLRGRIYTVKIHDVLRDLAIRIAEKDHRCYFKAGQGVAEFPVEEVVDGKGYSGMSLMYNHLHSLPTTFPCSSLSVLLLRENSGIKEVPESFLHQLPSLKVLDLSKTGITSLPPSIGDLKHLASLQLEGTDIHELPETIGDLKELQFLNVNRCQKLRCLPERISELKSLRVLNISYCLGLRQLPLGISELTSLERLEMRRSDISLHFEEDGNEERKFACLKDLQSLRRLRDLSVRMKSPVKEGVIGNWSKMRDLSLLFDDDVNQDYLPQDMQAMKDLESFTLGGCDVERLRVSEFRRLQYLLLRSCNQLRELELGMGFPKLETLRLWDLESLECVGAVAARASGSGGLGEGASQLPSMLKYVEVYGCKKLKRLRGEWDKLKCLEKIVGARKWWDAIEWEDPNMRTSLESKNIR